MVPHANGRWNGLRRKEARELVQAVTTNVGRSPITQPGYRRGQKPANAGRRFPPQALTEAEVMAILEQCDGDGRGHARDRALIVTLWRGGLRISEALDLEPHDVDLALGTVTVLHGKGDQWRIVGLDRQATDVIGFWMQLRERMLGLDRPDAPVHDGHRLFCTISNDPRPGRPLRDSCFRETLKLYGRKAGIRRRVHPHGLRHTHATELALENFPLHIIQEQLGHKDLATTARYIARLAPMARIRLLQERTWGQGELTQAQELMALSSHSHHRLPHAA
jgi:integrase